MSKNPDQSTPNYWIPIIGVIGVIIGAILGYLGTKASADAQIQAAKENANAQITAVWIQVYGPINATQTVEAKSTENALSIVKSPPINFSSTDAVTTTQEAPTPEPFSEAITVMNQFYTWINNAGNKDDLLKSWNLETSGINGLQCQEAAGCEYINFRDWWWEWKIQYKLYDCGSNIVDTEQRYYKRDPKLATTPTVPVYIRYQLVNDSGELKLNRGYGIEGPGSECRLKVSVP
jgi:hypothetical protein